VVVTPGRGPGAIVLVKAVNFLVACRDSTDMNGTSVDSTSQPCTANTHEVDKANNAGD
jgi:hypothetical protein